MEEAGAAVCQCNDGYQREGDACTPELSGPGELRLETPTRTLVLTILESGILRVRYLDSVEAVDRGWSMLPIAWPTEPLSPIDLGDSLSLATAELQIVIGKADATVSIFDAAGNLLSRDLPPGEDSASGATRRLAKAIGEGEHFFGFGEKTGPLDKRGRSMQMWTTDPWYPEPDYTPAKDPLYQAIPFYVGLTSGRAYGIYLNSTFRTGFDVGLTEPNTLTLWTVGGVMDYVFMAGPGMPKVLERATSIMGRTAMPPLWTLGYHQCRWSYAPESEVRAVVNEFQTRGIPLDGIWLDIDYMNGFRSFTFDPVGFPDPEGLFADLASQGVKATVIIDPGIKQDPGYSVYDTGVAGGHFVKLDGAPYVGQVWPGAAVFPDFTRPATRSWWGEYVAELVARGVRGVWIDMNEPTTWQPDGFPLDATFDGEGTPTDQREARNVYALLMAKATREGMLAGAPSRRPFVLTRAGFAGIQRHAAVWTGDMKSEWAHLAMAPTMLMSMGLSGVSFVGSDVGGFSGNPGGELFARWMQMGAISPFFRVHVMQGAPRQEPWSFGSTIEAASVAQIELRYRLLPMFYSLMRDAARVGAPVLRPLVYEFQSDTESPSVDNELLIGPHLLAAPVLWPSATERVVYLPAGPWVDYYGGGVFEGPGEVTVPAPLHRLPLLVRGNGIVPAWPAMRYVGERAPDPLYLDLFPATGAAAQSFTVRLDDGESFAYESGATHELGVELATSAGGVQVTLSPEVGTFTPPHEHLWLRFHGAAEAPASVTVEGEALAEASSLAALADQEGWWFDSAKQLLHARLARRPAGALVTVDYDLTQRQARMVDVVFKVGLPVGTPDGPIYVSTDVGGWVANGEALTRVSSTEAQGKISVVEGQTVAYKYTRGTWESVERDSACFELPNRSLTVLGGPDGEQRVIETVLSWDDWCARKRQRR